jgi:hypothetical protein
MKKTVALLFLTSLFFGGYSQTSVYQNLKTLLQETHPEINTTDKLIAYNIWSVNDAESREANKGFEKAYKVYESALLKGGKKGIIMVSFNKENLTSDAVITYTKDGIVKVIPYKISETTLSEAPISNAVYDSTGNEVYKNLSADKIYTAIKHLITR